MLYDPPGETTVVIPTLNEGKYLQRAISSLKAQDIVQRAPHRFEFMVVDSASTDDTREIAERNHFLFYPGPMGKLSARDLAFELADGEVVFSADADTYYPPGHLNLVLRHFQDKDVVGVFGPVIIEEPLILKLTSSMGYLWEKHRLFGMNNAIRREAYFDAGRFDLSTNQLDNWAMIIEEESNMLDKLRRVGDVVYDRQAAVFTSGRRQTGLDETFNQQVKKKLRFEFPY